MAAGLEENVDNNTESRTSFMFSSITLIAMLLFFLERVSRSALSQDVLYDKGLMEAEEALRFFDEGGGNVLLEPFKW
jgi:hypothetical protein